MAKAYIDHGKSEKGEPEYSIHGLTQEKLSLIMRCLKNNAGNDRYTGKELANELAETTAIKEIKGA